VIHAVHRCRDWAVPHDWAHRARRSSVHRDVNRGNLHRRHRVVTLAHRDEKADHRVARSSAVDHRDPTGDQSRHRASGVERPEAAESVDPSNSEVDRAAAEWDGPFG
jgi:hypothetical protein